MAKIKHKIAISAGKGGVGKSLVSANLAMALAMKGRKVSILDQDFDGPCIPKMFGVEGKKLYISERGIVPVVGRMGVQVVSTGSILKDGDVLTWFHDMRRSATEEFLGHVDYGDRDYLIVDLPPGTSSDAVNLMIYIPDLAGTVIVTIPPMVSQIVARRAANMVIKAKFRIFGVIENMSGYVCPECGREMEALQRGGGERLAQELGVPFWGRIPLDPRLSLSSDIGEPFVYKYPDSKASQMVMSITDQIEKMVGWEG